MPLSIEEADLDDPAHAAAILDVLDSHASDPVGGGRPLDGAVRVQLLPGLRRYPTTLVLLAFDEREPVGIAVCLFGFSTFQARPLSNVHDLAVAPAQRGRGIGSALLAAAESRARQAGCCKLTLEAHDDNHRARAVYTRFGFTDFVLGGDAVPTRFLSKSLGDGSGG